MSLALMMFNNCIFLIRVNSYDFDCYKQKLMSMELNTLLQESTLQVLRDQIQTLKHQNSVLIMTNQVLESQVVNIDIIQKQFALINCKNMELNTLLDVSKKRCENIETKSREEIRLLRQQIIQKTHYIQRLHIEHQKQLFRMSDENKQLKYQLKQKKQQNYDDLSRSIGLSHPYQYKGQQNSMDQSNSFINMDRSRSKSPINHSRISSTIIKKGQDTTTAKPQQLMKYSKQQLKLAIQSLNKVGHSLREGSMNISILQTRQSQIRSRPNN